MGPTWVLSAPDGPHLGPMNLAIRVVFVREYIYDRWRRVGGFPHKEPVMPIINVFFNMLAWANRWANSTVVGDLIVVLIVLRICVYMTLNFGHDCKWIFVIMHVFNQIRAGHGNFHESTLIRHGSDLTRSNFWSNWYIGHFLWNCHRWWLSTNVVVNGWMLSDNTPLPKLFKFMIPFAAIMQVAMYLIIFRHVKQCLARKLSAENSFHVIIPNGHTVQR